MVQYWLSDGEVLAFGSVSSVPEMVREELGTVLKKIKQLGGCVDKTEASQKFSSYI